MGFRLGPNADVQFQLELGPQTNTLPIGADAISNAATAAAAATKKRHTQFGGGSVDKPKEWLNAWRLEMSPGYVPDEDSGGGGGGGGKAADEVPAAVGLSDAVAHLRQLYKPQPVDR